MTKQEFEQRFAYGKDDKLGEGGFGKVFKAYDNYRDRWVAVKVSEVKPEMESVRLKKEVEMVSKLPANPNIAYYEESYTFSDRESEWDYGILQYYDEGNLNQLLKKADLTFEQKQSVLTQILSGIGFLHENGIIHRDLKPQNILIVKRGNGEYVPKITDFGISKKLDVNKSSVFGNSLVGGGTLAYSSPEQLGTATIRKNTDLWSFGIIAYQVLAGKLPFNTGKHSSNSEMGRVELMKQIGSGALPDDVNRLPELWQAVISRCVITDPERRARNVQEVKDILSGKIKVNLHPEPEPASEDKTEMGTQLGTELEFPTPKPQAKKPTPSAPKEPVVTPVEEKEESGNNTKKVLGIIAGCVLAVLAVLFFINSGGGHEDHECTDCAFSNLHGETFTYTGQLKNGEPHGIGLAIFPADDADERVQYDGTFINGQREGKGTLTYRDGSSYEGDFSKNTFEGRGKLTYSDGSFYLGNFESGLQNGRGRFYDAQKRDTIRGLFKNGTITVKD